MSTTLPPVDLVLLWHFHQPDYREPGGGRARLPWVRLHATKDYLDMARRLDPVPGVRVTFNFVPVLLDQLEAATGGGDVLFDLLRRPVETLMPSEWREIQSRCVQAPRHAFERWPDYGRLAERTRRAISAGLGDVAGGAPSSDRDLLALEAWFLLAWLDPMLLAEPEARAALAAGGRPTASHRDDLLALHDRLAAQVLPAYRGLAARGQIELSTSPYYHPILPLLVDHAAARRARPDLSLPRDPFVEPGDARLQLERALARHAEVFGGAPAGVWPSEGSVSPEVVEIAAGLGVRWLGSDEGVLLRSLPEGHRHRGAPYRPWALQTPAGEVALFFRDRELSDRIGFVYQQWEVADAVADFIQRLRRIAREHPGDEPPVVSVMLDGENCWGGYAEDGGPFLDQLYAALAQAPDVRTRTPSEVLDSAHVVPLLSHLHSGSWIDADFHVWIGHPEKNRAWELLGRARRRLAQQPEPDPAALEALLRAEGSDWFWWFGEDHYTPDKPVFDELFRGHLRAAHQALGEPVPTALEVPIAPAAWSPDLRQPPVGFMQPVIDGRPTHFYEWQPAGHVALAGGGAAMHAGTGLASHLYYGFDRDQFYLRIDFKAGAPPGSEHGLRLEWIEPASARLDIPSLVRGSQPVLRTAGGQGGEEVPETACRIGTILELAIPLAALAIQPGQGIELVVQLLEHGRPIETLPPGDAIRTRVPDDSFDVSVWGP